MDDSYLWNRTGPADPHIVTLERKLKRYAYGRASRTRKALAVGLVSLLAGAVVLACLDAEPLEHSTSPPSPPPMGLNLKQAHDRDGSDEWTAQEKTLRSREVDLTPSTKLTPAAPQPNPLTSHMP